nr:MAG TPA: hypothetical protein [Caudoviricetes sp.]
MSMIENETKQNKQLLYMIIQEYQQTSSCFRLFSL